VALRREGAPWVRTGQMQEPPILGQRPSESLGCTLPKSMEDGDSRCAVVCNRGLLLPRGCSILRGVQTRSDCVEASLLCSSPAST
jgi:hypothetical protein